MPETDACFSTEAAAPEADGEARAAAAATGGLGSRGGWTDRPRLVPDLALWTSLLVAAFFEEGWVCVCCILPGNAALPALTASD